MNKLMNKNVIFENADDEGENSVRSSAENFSMKDVWSVVSPLLTVFCMLACSMGALQFLTRVV